MFYKIPANLIDLSPTHREIIAFEFVAELMDHPVFLVLGQYLTQLWQVKGQIFGNSMIFQLHESI